MSGGDPADKDGDGITDPLASSDGSPTPASDGNSDGGTTNVSNPAVDQHPDAVVPQDIVADDGKLLWASPTSGPAVDLGLVPAGSGIYLVARPADILASAEGAKVMRGLGPEFAALRKTWEEASKFRLDEIEQLVVSIHTPSGGSPRPAFVVRPKQAMASSDLLARWGNPAPVASEA